MKRVGIFFCAALFALALFWYFPRAYHTPALGSAVREGGVNAREGAAVAAGRAGAPQAATPRNIPNLPGSSPSVTANSEGPSAARAFDEHISSDLQQSKVGDPVRFELVRGEMASGTIDRLEFRDGGVSYVAGRLTNPRGKFFFQRQSEPGLAGACVGVVEIAGRSVAYRVEPTGKGGAPELVERPIESVICVQMPLPPDGATTSEDDGTQEIPPLRPGDYPTYPVPPYQQGIIALESLPGAEAVLYLDFQGGYTETWGGISYERPTVSNGQIRDVWTRVAEDYMPFRINVTTDLKVYQSAGEVRRQRVIVTPTTTARPGAGGVAYTGSFNWSGDTPCWVFIMSGKNCAEACSHEAGHTLGLNHDGKNVNGTLTEYYSGQGSGDTGWAPIMGTGYSRNITQWDKGEYQYANNSQDDLSVITTRNNSVTYRADDTGATMATARYLDVSTNYQVSAQGVIERTGDVDAFIFKTGGGQVSIRVDPVSPEPNLAVKVSLCDETDRVIAAAEPQSSVGASIATNVDAGVYLVRVAGAGRHDPFTDGFSSYGSLGYYSVSGSVENGEITPRFTVPEDAAAGDLVGILSAVNPASHALSMRIAGGNTSGAFAIDDGGRITVADPAALDYETLAAKSQMPVQFELSIDTTDLVDGSATEFHRRVVIAVSNVNEPPTLVPYSSLLVFERTRLNTVIGPTAIGSDPDLHTLISFFIASGNEKGLFRIDPQTGQLSVGMTIGPEDAGSYPLKVAVSDQNTTMPLSATTGVLVVVAPNDTPFSPGQIAYTAYTNLPGTSIASLTNAAVFPLQPDWEQLMTSFDARRDVAEKFGAVFRGYVFPPVTGVYTFYLSSDDSSELFLSSSTNPASMAKVAYVADGNYTAPGEYKYATQQHTTSSALQAGKAYYIEARMRDAGGNDHLEVAWSRGVSAGDAGMAREIIPGRYLASFYLNYRPRPVDASVSLHRDALTSSKVLALGVRDANTNDQETLLISAGNEAGIFYLDPATRWLRVADAAALANAPFSTCTLTITATDNGSPPLSGSGRVTVSLVAPEAITATSPQQEIFYSVGSGTGVSDLTNKVKFPRRPDALKPVTGFEGARNLADSYGSRIRALVTPSTTGSAVFFISSDDSGRLLYAPDLSTATAPTRIAYLDGASDVNQWSRAATQRSAPINVVAGRPFYLEALQKEGGGEDHVEVGWIAPGSGSTNTIPASALQPVDINYAPVMSGRSVTLPLSSAPGTQVGALTATDSPIDASTYRIAEGNEAGAFVMDPDTGVVRVADRVLLADLSAAEYNLVVQAQDSGYGDLYPRRSVFATLHISILDDLRPQLLPAVGSGAGDLLVRAYTENGRTWELQGSDSLEADGVWEPLGTAWPTAGMVQFSVPITDAQRRFFRLKLK